MPEKTRLPDTFGAALRIAKVDADSIAEKAAADEFPELAALGIHLGTAFDAAFSVVEAAAWNKALEPAAIAAAFATLDERLAHTEPLMKPALEVWPKNYGATFSQFTGDCALLVLRQFLRAVRTALIYTLGYGKANGRFPSDVESLATTGDQIGEIMGKWPMRALEELRERTLLPAHGAAWRRDANKLTNQVDDEFRRAKETLAHLQTLDWYTLGAFGNRACTIWDDHPHYRDRVRTLAAKLRGAARDAGVTDTSDTERVYCDVRDWLVSRKNRTAGEADKLPVADIFAMLAARPESSPALLPATRFKLSDDNLTATLDGTPFALTEDQGRVVRKLVGAGGAWVPSRSMKSFPDSEERPDKIIARLPAPLRAVIEAKRGVGYRLTLV